MNFEAIISLPKRFGCKCRIETSTSGRSKWDTRDIIPTNGYVELPVHGPVLASDILWFEIDPVERRRVGKLVPDKLIDHTGEIRMELDQLNFEFETVDGNIRIITQ